MHIKRCSWGHNTNKFCRRHPIVPFGQNNPWYHFKFGYRSGSNQSPFAGAALNRL